MGPQDYSYSYNAAQAFSNMYAMNTVGMIASQNRVIMSASTPGLPSDTFHRTSTYTSSRFAEPISKTKQFFKDFGSMVSSIGFVAKIAQFFFPPAAIVATVSDMAGPVMDNFNDTTPKPMVYNTLERYNPWMR